MKIKRDSPGNYYTDDGRFEINLVDDYETECDDPHPVRLRVDTMTHYSDWFKKSLMSKGTIKWKKGVEYLCYYCEGNETHFYSRWIVWDIGAADYADNSGPSGFDTYRDARQFLMRLYENHQSTLLD